MPRKSKPARLWLKPATAKRNAVWLILDGGHQYSTSCGPDAYREAERKLKEYIAAKHDPAASVERHPSVIPVADVLSVYLDEVVPEQARPAKVAARIGRLIGWWGDKRLSEVAPTSCRAYASGRGRGGSRRDLEDLRAAINHHAKRGLHVGYIRVELPRKGAPRSTWLMRSEVARLLWACWRHTRPVRLPRGRKKGEVVASDWHDLHHVARFILMTVYTASRSGAVFTASIHPGANRSFVDLEHFQPNPVRIQRQ